jgi:hypothetical protein
MSRRWRARRPHHARAHNGRNSLAALRLDRRSREPGGPGAERRVGVIALTDSSLSPLAVRARAVLTVPTATPSFFHTMSAAFAVAEMLAALVVAERGPQAIRATQQTGQELRSLYAYLDADRGPRRRARVAKEKL